jgi:hypothetical protein
VRQTLGPAFAAALLSTASTAVVRAQAPLPALPPPSAEPPSPPPPAAPAPEPAQAAPSPPPLVAEPPPAVLYVEPPKPTFAPRYSLWVGGRLGLLAYGGGIYNDLSGNVETTGNFVRSGLGLELNVGARIDKRYIPYVALELGAVPPGHRFDSDSSARAHTTFLGIGFRDVLGDVDVVGFAWELSFGFRSFNVSNASGSWSASGFELFRLGLGAEIRINRRFAVSPMVTLSGATLTDTSGHISFAPNQGDGQSGPPLQGSGTIPSQAQAMYYAIVLGCGGHVDLLGQ